MILSSLLSTSLPHTVTSRVELPCSLYGGNSGTRRPNRDLDRVTSFIVHSACSRLHGQLLPWQRRCRVTCIARSEGRGRGGDFAAGTSGGGNCSRLHSAEITGNSDESKHLLQPRSFDAKLATGLHNLVSYHIGHVNFVSLS